jgi:hypothetical protein
MKTKLIKEYEDYYLISDKEIESGDEYVKLDNRPRTLLLGTTISHVTKVSKLSKQNCDEIFGVVDVDDLAYEHRRVYQDSFEGMNVCIMKDAMHQQVGFVAGFNKAMELNKDKVFTLEDIMNCWNKALKFQEHKQTLGEYIQSLQQPTEIEVTFNPDEKDSEGCLILKKI